MERQADKVIEACERFEKGFEMAMEALTDAIVIMKNASADIKEATKEPRKENV
jgi:hypothetical protein